MKNRIGKIHHGKGLSLTTHYYVNESVINRLLSPALQNITTKSYIIYIYIYILCIILLNIFFSFLMKACVFS